MVVEVVVALVDGLTLELLSVELGEEPVVVVLLEPGAPIELVLPDVSLLAVPEVVPPVVPPVPEPVVEPPIALVLPVLPVPLVPGELLLLEVAVSLLGAGTVVVEEEEVDVGGASSRLVHAPSETAATSARAAHEVRVDFIRKLLEGFLKKKR